MTMMRNLEEESFREWKFREMRENSRRVAEHKRCKQWMNAFDALLIVSDGDF